MYETLCTSTFIDKKAQVQTNLLYTLILHSHQFCLVSIRKNLLLTIKLCRQMAIHQVGVLFQHQGKSMALVSVEFASSSFGLCTNHTLNNACHPTNRLLKTHRKGYFCTFSQLSNPFKRKDPTGAQGQLGWQPKQGLLVVGRGSKKNVKEKLRQFIRG